VPCDGPRMNPSLDVGNPPRPFRHLRMAERRTPDPSSSRVPVHSALVQKSVTVITNPAGRLSLWMLGELPPHSNRGPANSWQNTCNQSNPATKFCACNPPVGLPTYGAISNTTPQPRSTWQVLLELPPYPVVPKRWPALSTSRLSNGSPPPTRGGRVTSQFTLVHFAVPAAQYCFLTGESPPRSIGYGRLFLATKTTPRRRAATEEDVPRPVPACPERSRRGYPALRFSSNTSSSASANRCARF
jgi:hypothetical protein